jgi:hypothetical protein
MINKLIVLSTFLISIFSFGQSFSPAPGQSGSTAIHKDSSIILGWANTCVVQRGPKQIDQPGNGMASFGVDANGVGVAEGNSLDIVSFGDGGSAILTFNPPIKNGNGPDFAVFENGFTDHYMEFAFVEVSSNGIDYYRFPAVSETPLTPQMNNASYGDCAYIHNLAGKYRQGYGTPFDLQDLDSISTLNLNAISHVRLIDVVGNVNSVFGTLDHYGTIINDPWPTNFESSGFDLDGIAVIHQGFLDISEHKLTFEIYPNPFTKQLTINTSVRTSISITNQLNKEVYIDSDVKNSTLNLTELESGYYFITIRNSQSRSVIPIIKN